MEKEVDMVARVAKFHLTPVIKILPCRKVMPSRNKTPSYNLVDEAKTPENQPTWERLPRSLARPFKIPRCAPSTSTSPSSTTSPRTYRASSNRYAETASRLKYRRILARSCAMISPQNKTRISPHQENRRRSLLSPTCYLLLPENVLLLYDLLFPFF